MEVGFVTNFDERSSILFRVVSFEKLVGGRVRNSTLQKVFRPPEVDLRMTKGVMNGRRTDGKHRYLRGTIV